MFDFLSHKFSSLFSRLESSKTLTESAIQETMDQVQEALLEADVPYGVVQSFTQGVKDEVVGSKAIGSLKPSEQLLTVVQKKIVDFLGGDVSSFEIAFPSIVMVMGLQGSGKTTTL